jgi:hypothetical protein
MNKDVDIANAGQQEVRRITISENTTALEALQLAGCPEGYELSPADGLPPFGKDEKIFDRCRAGGKLIAGTRADAGVLSR